MKISGTQTHSVEAERPATSSSAAGKSATRGATKPSETKVAVSDAGSQLAASSTGSAFDAQKVASISAAIANGTYKVNSGAIADKMLSGVSELAGKK